MIIMKILSIRKGSYRAKENLYTEEKVEAILYMVLANLFQTKPLKPSHAFEDSFIHYI